MNKKIPITILVIVIALAGVLYWHNMQKKSLLKQSEQTTPDTTSRGWDPGALPPLPAKQAVSFNADINTALEKITSAQNTSSFDTLDCSKISGSQFIGLGDAVMAVLAGDETHHSAMEKAMGGETSAMTDMEHTKLGQLYLSCSIKNSMSGSKVMDGDMNSKSGSMTNKNGMDMSMSEMHPAAIKYSSSLGEYLVDGSGMTLYTYSKDSSGVSNCSGDCLANWPAYTISKQGAKDLGVYYKDLATITRADGSLQISWKGMPLYYFTKDKAVGDAMGQGVGGLWQVVKFK